MLLVAMARIDNRVLLSVSVRTATKVLVPPSFERLDSNWVASHTCIQLLEKLLREHRNHELVDTLQSCCIDMVCTRAVGVLNTFNGSKRARGIEEKFCTTFLHDNLETTLQIIDSDELAFVITPPPEPQPRPVVDATERLMRAARRVQLPPPLAHRRMNGDHHLYNCILDYLRDEGVGWTDSQMSSGQEFLDHVSRACWMLTPKVCAALVRHI